MFTARKVGRRNGGSGLKGVALILLLCLVVFQSGGCAKKQTLNTAGKSTVKTELKTTAGTKTTARSVSTAVTGTGSTSQQTGSGTEERVESTENSENQTEGSGTEENQNETTLDLNGRVILVNITADISDWVKQGGIYQGDERYSSIKNVEKKYNCKFEFRSDIKNNAVWSQNYISSYSAGVKLTDVIRLATAMQFPNYVVSKLITPIDQYVDCHDPLWGEGAAFNQAYWRGRYYGLSWGPFGSNSRVVHFNKDIFARDALPDLQDLADRMQWKWEDLLNIAINATKDFNGDGVIDQWGVVGTYAEVFSAILGSNNATLIREENGFMKAGIDTREVLTALDFVRSLYNIYKVAANSSSYFLNGNAAMYITGVIGKTYWPGVGLNNVGLVPLPIGPNADRYISYATNAVPWTFPNNIDDIGNVVRAFKEAWEIWNPKKEVYMEAKQLIWNDTKAFGMTDRDVEWVMRLRTDKNMVYDFGLNFTEYNNIFTNNIVIPVTNGTMPSSTAISMNLNAAQAAINFVLGQ